MEPGQGQISSSSGAALDQDWIGIGSWCWRHQAAVSLGQGAGPDPRDLVQVVFQEEGPWWSGRDGYFPAACVQPAGPAGPAGLSEACSYW